jgi:hypothetical protein
MRDAGADYTGSAAGAASLPRRTLTRVGARLRMLE